MILFYLLLYRETALDVYCTKYLCFMPPTPRMPTLVFIVIPPDCSVCMLYLCYMPPTPRGGILVCVLYFYRFFFSLTSAMVYVPLGCEHGLHLFSIFYFLFFTLWAVGQGGGIQQQSTSNCCVVLSFCEPGSLYLQPVTVSPYICTE